MKYFQNVVDIVRDLMCPQIDERSYKEGFRKDDDGFIDILWCRKVRSPAPHTPRPACLHATGSGIIVFLNLNSR